MKTAQDHFRKYVDDNKTAALHVLRHDKEAIAVLATRLGDGTYVVMSSAEAGREQQLHGEFVVASCREAQRMAGEMVVLHQALGSEFIYSYEAMNDNTETLANLKAQGVLRTAHKRETLADLIDAGTIRTTAKAR